MSAPLEPHDKASPVWGKLVAHLKARREKLRDLLESDLTTEETSMTRGQLAEIRALLSMDKDRAPID